MLFIFDMGGVVTNTFYIEKVLDKLHISKDEFLGICEQTEINIWNQLQTGKITTEGFWREFSKRISYVQRASLDGLVKIGTKIKFSTESTFSDVPEIKTDLFRLCFHPELNKKTVEIIENLKKKHRVVCGTNTMDSHWETHMERGDYSYFHQTYASNKIGFAKPDPEFFKIIMEAEEVTDPSQVFFTDDKLSNCEAAESVGINAVHFQTAEDLEKKWKQYYN